MLNPTQTKYAEQIQALIDEGEEIATFEKPSKAGVKTVQDHERLQAWLGQVKNIVHTTFGRQNSQSECLEKLYTEEKLYYAANIRKINGLLRGALDDLKNGYLKNQELLITGKVSNDVLEQAQNLCNAGIL